MSATAKCLINSIDTAVTETLSGLCCTYPQLDYHVSHKVVLAPDYKNREGKVAIICGGGSGHEPFAAGFVGTGMLTASVAGFIYAAPPSVHITHALKCVSLNNKAGVLVVVPNYTGDCLNFGIAIEKARKLGLLIAEIIVGEDCSIPESEQSIVGKRGLTGMLFIIKIAGALAEQGLSLHEIHNIAQIVLRNIATYAVGLTACAIPGQGPMFELANNEIECGMGVHGEAGYERRKLKTTTDTVALMLERICSALSLDKGDSVAVIINNFGALSQLEQGIVVHEVVKQLHEMGVHPERVYTGLLMTSLNSAGIHISVLKLIKNHKTLFLNCLDEKTNAPAWPGCAYSIPLTQTKIVLDEKEENKEIQNIGIGPLSEQEQKLIKLCIQNSCTAVIEKEVYLNDLDSGCGDGDCGSTLCRFANGVLQLTNLCCSYPSSLFSELAKIAEDCMGGTSGALYCLLFTTIANELTFTEPKEKWSLICLRALRNGLNCLMKYGKAKVGDRTMIDTIHTVCQEWEKVADLPVYDVYEKLVAAAWKGCEATKTMKPNAGRASYVKQAQYMKQVDAGAYGAAIWITAVLQTITNFTEK